jgi:membrane associated rhomboid family serine protease
MPLYPEDVLLVRVHIKLLLSLVAIAWLAHLVNFITNYSLNWMFKLRPRNPWGLVGIPLAPFLHGDWPHLIGNTPVFLTLGWLVLLQGIHLFYVVTIAVALFSGFFTWLLDDRPGVGASGVIFGYFGFLLVYGFTSGDKVAAIATVFCGVLYGSIIWGIFPSQDKSVGWMAHLFGFVGGILMALWIGDLRQNHY